MLYDIYTSDVFIMKWRSQQIFGNKKIKKKTKKNLNDKTESVTIEQCNNKYVKK